MASSVIWRGHRKGGRTSDVPRAVPSSTVAHSTCTEVSATGALGKPSRDQPESRERRPDDPCIPTQESSGWPGTSLSSVSCSVASISSGAAGPRHRSRYRRRLPPARRRGLVSRHGDTTLDSQAAALRAMKTAHGRVRTGSRGSRGYGGLFLGSDLVRVAVLALRGARGALTRPPRAARPLGTRQEHPSQSVRPPKRILAPG